VQSFRLSGGARAVLVTLRGRRLDALALLRRDLQHPNPPRPIPEIAMQLVQWAHRAVSALERVPGVKGALQRRYERRFRGNRSRNLFRGVFTDAAAARASAPEQAAIDYDNPQSAALYRDRLDRVYPSDYPVLYWLARLAGQWHKVVDFGGHVGVAYYAYRRYLDYPGQLRWTVYDLPAVTASGRQLALERDAGAQLAFSDDFAAAAAGADLLFASGSLQYLDRPLAELLAPVQPLPRRLLVNLLPLHPQHGYYTLQSIGTAFCPYRIERDADFIAGLAALGYRLVDRWENPEKRCPIPWHPEHSLDGYHGLLFER
jgi:putative methyltransferase (TIGR04325 family)